MGISAGWPFERAAAQEVDVQVRDGFAAVAAVIDDEAEAAFGDALLGGDGRGSDQEAAEQVGVIFVGSGDARDDFFRNDQNVQG